MSGRKFIGALVLALAACLLGVMAFKAYAGGGVGSAVISTVNTARYALFGGSYSVPGGQPESGVFKIDSYTGDTWVLKVDGPNAKNAGKWVLIPSSSVPSQPPSVLPPGE